MRKLPVATLALAALLTLSGCVPVQPPVTSTPVPSSTPVFASDEDALAAAEAAYGHYLAISDEVTAGGGLHPEKMQSLVSEDQYQLLMKSMKSLADKGWRTSGSTAFEQMTLASRTEEGQGAATLDLYLCVDVSAVRILDSSGLDVTPSTRVNVVALEVSFDVARAASPEFVLTNSDSWTGTEFC